MMIATIGLLLPLASADAASFVLAADGRARASIVTTQPPTPAARLAALELQHYIEAITGARLPIVDDSAKVAGARILVGESVATRALGLKGEDFAPQEYIVDIRPDTIILMGRDWLDTPENRAEAGRGTNWGTTLAEWRKEIDYAAATGQEGPEQRIELPGLFDDQGTCYAVYDFLERHCGVRWYGPTPLNIVAPSKPTLEAAVGKVRRAPAMPYREGIGGGWPIVKAQWNNPSGDQLDLYWRRLRVGGEKWGGNHSFMSFQDRFLQENPERPELFEGARPEYFAHGQEGGAGERQFCYTNPALIQQVAQDARDYFDGRGIKGYQVAMGDTFAIVPLDNGRWCKCDTCQEALAKDKDNKRGSHFNTGTATHYLFGFIDAVAQEVAKTHPDKFISALAYHVYAYPPTEFDLAPNVIVAPCLQARQHWAPLVWQNDLDFYKRWVAQPGRRVYLWNYYCFPMEPAAIQGWHCFPGFSAHTLAKQIKMYHADGVRGVFLCGIGEQVDYYLTMKMYDDPAIDADALLDEFFTAYFGAAAAPMQAFYERIEAIYSNPLNYPEEVRKKETQYHQNARVAWECLGTEERMAELQALIERAQARASSDVEKRRVQTWTEGVWDYMAEGRRAYFEEKAAKKR
ncbi:MAG: DUF4838 domain-containing protein [Nitrospiraceae bacterium]|nr:DUF4838 domain-containing protein [Nitrospiraceae bacterium]